MVARKLIGRSRGDQVLVSQPFATMDFTVNAMSGSVHAHRAKADVDECSRLYRDVRGAYTFDSEDSDICRSFVSCDGMVQEGSGAEGKRLYLCA